jgi:hypothetical protein
MCNFSAAVCWRLQNKLFFFACAAVTFLMLAQRKRAGCKRGTREERRTGASWTALIACANVVKALFARARRVKTVGGPVLTRVIPQPSVLLVGHRAETRDQHDRFSI